METTEAFLNASTRDRLTMALDDRNRVALSRLLGEPAYLELRTLAKEWFDGFHLAPEDPKNMIFVPGVMGSLLMNSAKAGIWWIDVRTRNFIDSLRLSPDGTKDADSENRIEPVTADPSYTPFLSAALKQHGLNHEIFSYDWRKSLLQSAAALRDLVLKLHQANGGKKVNLVAHSMGGLMVRTALMQHGAELWPKLGKIVFIGTPHYGATAIAGYVKNHLWGFELMAMLGRYLSRATLRSLCGVIGMLPAPRGIYPGTRENDPNPWQPEDAEDPYVHPCANFDLYQADAWKLDLDAAATANLQRILDAAADLHQRLYETHRSLDQQQRDQMIVIAGVGYQTLFRLAYRLGFFGLWEKTDKTLHRVLNDPHREGDGRVPLASARLENVGETRYINGVHGGLTNIVAVYQDVFRCLTDQPMQLPSSVAEALSGHLAEPTTSKAPYMDGTAAVTAGGDDPGLWQIDNPSVERMQELEAMLVADQLPGFGRLHLL
jgi:pimeloyl-ACP methyl ester carboxylesterase